MLSTESRVGHQVSTERGSSRGEVMPEEAGSFKLGGERMGVKSKK